MGGNQADTPVAWQQTVLSFPLLGLSDKETAWSVLCCARGISAGWVVTQSRGREDYLKLGTFGRRCPFSVGFGDGKWEMDDG